MGGIVCTISPRTVVHLEDMKTAGMTLMRINGSFGLPDTKAMKKMGLPILLDIPGDRNARKKKRPSPLSDDDLLRLAVENKLDFVGISYVKNAGDVEAVRKKLRDLNGDIRIVAKVETAEACENLKEIVEAADMILVDRGDLGTAIGFENVPEMQSLVVRHCNGAGKKVIVATEMLMSTIAKKKPNCADVTDVYYAVDSGADYVMLSEETAMERDPVAPVAIMRKIIGKAKKEPVVVYTYGAFDLFHPGHTRFIEKAKKHGDKLIVGMVGDAAIRELKGDTRPTFPLKARTEIIRALKGVDRVVDQGGYDPVPMLKKLAGEGIKISVLCKGDDWDYIPGHEYIESIGGRLVKPPYDPEYSTSETIKRIIEVHKAGDLKKRKP